MSSWVLCSYVFLCLLWLFHDCYYLSVQVWSTSMLVVLMSMSKWMSVFVWMRLSPAQIHIHHILFEGADVLVCVCICICGCFFIFVYAYVFVFISVFERLWQCGYPCLLWCQSRSMLWRIFYVRVLVRIYVCVVRSQSRGGLYRCPCPFPCPCLRFSLCPCPCQCLFLCVSYCLWPWLCLDQSLSLALSGEVHVFATVFVFVLTVSVSTSMPFAMPMSISVIVSVSLCGCLSRYLYWCLCVCLYVGVCFYV